eukprot:2199197-Rhodomonas_salina.3
MPLLVLTCALVLPAKSRPPPAAKKLDVVVPALPQILKLPQVKSAMSLGARYGKPGTDQEYGATRSGS